MSLHVVRNLSKSDQIIRLGRWGFSCRTIARIIGLSHVRVAQIMRDGKVPNSAWNKKHRSIDQRHTRIALELAIDNHSTHGHKDCSCGRPALAYFKRPWDPFERDYFCRRCRSSFHMEKTRQKRRERREALLRQKAGVQPDVNKQIENAQKRREALRKEFNLPDRENLSINVLDLEDIANA